MKRLLTVLLCACALPALGQDAPEMVPLKLDLPRPMFVGTPVPVKLPNLEKPLGRARPDMMVPAGTVLLSANKKVTGSDDFPVIGELEYLTDGDKEGAEGSYVELGPMLQWAQIDLEAPAKIQAIAVWHFHAQARAYHDFIVQISNDPDFLEGVTTVYNNDHDNSAGMGVGKDLAYIETSEGRLVDAKAATGRYVRLYTRGNTANEMNHYIEVEIYGMPAEAP